MSTTNYNIIMDVRNEIKSIIAKKAQTLKNVCEIMTQKSNKTVMPNNITNKLRRGTIKFNEIQDMLDVLDYHIEFIPNNH